MFDKLFSRHMKIERMLIISGVLFLALMCVLFNDMRIIHKRSRTTLSDEPVLSGSSTTSVTSTSLAIKNIYRSKDKTQAMVVISGDLSKLSYSADTYEVYFVGPSASQFSGGLYVFGDLDLMCIYVTNMNSFKAEKTQLILKSTSSTGAATLQTTDNATFVVNLGAANAVTASFMSDAGLNIEEMIKTAFCDVDDNNIRTQLVSLQEAAVSARVTLSNVRENIGKADMQIPTFPEWMEWTEDGEQKHDYVGTRENTGRQYLRTGYVFNGTADFDWENTSRLNTYSDVAGISASSISSNSVKPNVNDDIPKQWYKSDNSLITEPTKSEQSLINQYGTALTNYYNAKYAYQSEVAQLITTQNKYLSLMKNYTSNLGGNAVVGVTKK